MGQDFIRRRNDRFRRLRDEGFRKLTEADLFSQASPQCVTNVAGTVLPQSEVSPGDRVWGDADREGRAITFFRGDTPVVEVPAAAADALLADHELHRGTLVGIVTSVDASNQIAVMRLCDVTEPR
jgi:hypothetical protein